MYCLMDRLNNAGVIRHKWEMKTKWKMFIFVSLLEYMLQWIHLSDSLSLSLSLSFSLSFSLYVCMYVHSVATDLNRRKMTICIDIEQNKQTNKTKQSRRRRKENNKKTVYPYKSVLLVDSVKPSSVAVQNVCNNGHNSSHLPFLASIGEQRRDEQNGGEGIFGAPNGPRG